MNRPIFIRANSLQWAWSKEKKQSAIAPPSNGMSSGDKQGDTVKQPPVSISPSDVKRKIVDELDVIDRQSEKASSSKTLTPLDTIDEHLHYMGPDDQAMTDEIINEANDNERDLPETLDKKPQTLSDIVSGNIMSSQDVAEYFHEQFTAFVNREAGRQPLDVVLSASTALLQEFVSVCPTNRMDRAMIHFELDAYIFPRLSLLYSDISKLKASQVAKLISWAHQYQSSLTQMGMDVPKTRLCDFEEFVTEYLKRGVHDQMNLMIRNSLLLRQKEEVKEDESGQLVTCHPEDIAFMFEMQMSVAKESLPQCFVSEVLSACNEEVFNMISDVMLDVESHWKEMGVEKLCATINDASRLSDQCDERNEELLDGSNLQQVKIGNDLCKELTELSLHATRYLCERIMLDLHDPDRILTRVGDPNWETEQDASVIDTTILTLKDYFSDIHEWVPHGYFFPKCVKHCFDMTMQMYVHSFFSNTMAYGIEDPIQASMVLQKDWRKLLKFFRDETGDYAGQAGHHTKEAIVARLDLLQALALLLTPTIPPDQLEMELQTTILQLGGVEAASPALLHVAGLRQKGATKETKAREAMWHETLERVTIRLEKMLPSDQGSSLAFYKLPDLRNSEYLRRIQLSSMGDSTSNVCHSTLRSIKGKKLTRWNSLAQRPGIGQALGASFRASRRRVGWRPASDRTLISTWRDQDGSTTDDSTASSSGGS